MFRPLTRSLSRSNQQSYGFTPESSSNRLTHSAANPGPSTTHGGHLPPRARASRDYSRLQTSFDQETTNDSESRYNHDAAYYQKVATHMDLLQAGNQAYGSLYDAFTALKGRYDELRASYDQLAATVKTMLDTSGTASSSTAPHTGLAPQAPAIKFTREEYPRIKFPRQRDYKLYRKQKTKGAGVLGAKGGHRLNEHNENVRTDYVEYEDGTTVMGDTAKAIRQHARAALIEMEREDTPMNLPTTWSKAGITERKYFIHEMYGKFPYLALCEDDWKVVYLASRALSAFHEYRKRQAAAKSDDAKVKREKGADTKIESDESQTPNPGKPSSPCPDDDDDEDHNIYAPEAASSSPSSKRKAPTVTSEESSKRVRKEVPIDLTGDSDESASSSTTTPAVSPSSSSGLSEPPSSPPILAQDPPPSNPAPAITDRTSNGTSNIPSVGVAPAAGASTTPETIVVENPFASLFGPATGPSGRLDSLAAASKGVANDAVKAPSTAAAIEGGRDKSPDSEKASIARAKAFGPGTKKVTNTTSAKNLYYIDYLQENEPITPAAFDAHWGGLNKGIVKKYMLLSKNSK